MLSRITHGCTRHHTEEHAITTAFTASLTAPIREETPFGESINHDPDFDILKSEICRLTGADHALIEAKCLSIIRTRSKDIRVFLFLSLVYLCREDWGAFADVFAALTDLAGGNFHGLFPLRPRARRLAFGWLSGNRYRGLAHEKEPGSAARGHVERLLVSLTELRGILGRNFPDESPFPSDLLALAGQWERTSAPKPETAQTPQPGQRNESGPLQGTPALAGIDSPKEALALCRKIALFLIEKEPRSPTGYRLLRLARWGGVSRLPPNDAGRTRIEPPAPENRVSLQGLMHKGKWAEVLSSSEAAFGSGPTVFQLRLQYISAFACKEMDDACSQVRDVICLETALLLKRLPGIADLTFSDGTPLCDGATMDWINGPDVAGAPGPPDPSSKKATPSASSAIDEERERANSLRASGRTGQAVEFLQGRIGSSRNERDDFRRALLMAELLLSAKHRQIAVALLESLEQTIDRYHLDKWDPDLAVQVWSLLLTAYRAGKNSGPQSSQTSLIQKEGAVLARISCIDPGAALRIKPST